MFVRNCIEPERRAQILFIGDRKVTPDSDFDPVVITAFGRAIGLLIAAIFGLAIIAIVLALAVM